MATGESRTFDVDGHIVEARVVGPLGQAKKSWLQSWKSSGLPEFEWVAFFSTDLDLPERARTLIYCDTLSSLPPERLREKLHHALRLARLPPAEGALALVRDGTQLVLTWGDWNRIQALAAHCGWKAERSDEVSDSEARSLAGFYRDAEATLGKAKMAEMRFEPPDGLLDFLEKGAFQLVPIDV